VVETSILCWPQALGRGRHGHECGGVWQHRHGMARGGGLPAPESTDPKPKPKPRLCPCLLEYLPALSKYAWAHSLQLISAPLSCQINLFWSNQILKQTRLCIMPQQFWPALSGLPRGETLYHTDKIECSRWPSTAISYSPTTVGYPPTAVGYPSQP